MRRAVLFLTLLSGAAIVAACTRSVPSRVITPLPFEQAMGLSPIPTRTATATCTPSPTSTATATSTPLPTLTPTVTPVPSQRLATGQQAFRWGDYEQAQQEFAALRGDPGANADERREAAFWVGRSALEAGDYVGAIVAFEEFQRSYPDDARLASAQFMVAGAQEGRSDWRKAIAAYRRYLQLDRALAMDAYDGIGKAAMALLDYEQAAGAYTDGLRYAIDTSWAVYVREEIANAELARNRPLEAVKQYDAILGVARIDDYRSRILFQSAQAYIQAGDQKAARQRYAQAVEGYPTTQYAYLSLVELVNAGAQVDDYQRGLVDYHAEAYGPAIDALTRVVRATPSARGGDALWYLALSLKANGNLTQSIQRFQELVNGYPQNTHNAEARLEIADAYASRGDQDVAVDTYRTFVTAQPDSPLGPQALWSAARLQEAGADFVGAAATYRDLVARYSQSEDAPEALFKAALLDYRRADYEGARNGWQSLVEKYPDSASATAGRFWVGKAWLALDKPDKAQAAFEAASQRAPDTYYGLRAAEMLAGVPVLLSDGFGAPLRDPGGSQAEAEAWLANWLGIPATDSVSALLPTIVQDPAWRRGVALLDVGRRTEALEELENVKQNWWNDPLAMYQLALAFREHGLYRLSILCAERLTWTSPVTRRSQVPLFIQKLSHPLYYRELITAEAQALEIDPLLFSALVRQESLFEASITSAADARGLAQVIPPTGEWIADQLGWSDWQAADLWRPYVSVPFGTYYLNVQLNAFDNQVIPALAAYNAGPGRVRDWLATESDVDLFVETMAYAEPRRYVRNIYGEYYQYQRLYRPQP
jgi:soluble lytic murein transglycosylase